MVKELTIFTIGHSTRTPKEFVELLQIYLITLVVDVRTVPHSRHNPQFNKATLPITLKPYGISYLHLPQIGGLRRPKPDSVNLALRESGFRGYADYMQTKEFTDNLLKIVALIRQRSVALMCAEALPWRCHRILISDSLVIRKINVKHIISKENIIEHQLKETANVEGTKITYPLYTKVSAQRALGDFDIKT